MAEAIYTQKEYAQYRGPTTSDRYNERLENLYKDLVYLYNKIGIAEEDLRFVFQRAIKEQLSLSKFLSALEDRIEALEAGENRLSFYITNQIDSDRFNPTAYNISTANRLSYNSRYGVVTLPKIEGSSTSKIRFNNEDNTVVLPPSCEVAVLGVDSSEDNSTNLVDSSDPYYALLGENGKIWERNVITESIDASNGAQCYMYVRLPMDVQTSADSNAIVIHPFPAKGVDLLEVAISTDVDAVLNNTDNYVPLNPNGLHSGNTDAIGWIAPGGWNGDIMTNAGPTIFYFDPKPITAIRLKLRQKNYYEEASKFIYSYGLSHLDVRLDKFLDTGKAVFRFDAPDGDTITSIDNVIPQMWNVSEAEAPYVFSHRVIWETSFDSGNYTLTPVPFSQRVWIEVTLNKTIKNATPALSGLIVNYS